MTSHPSPSYKLKTSSARQTPWVPSTAIVRTLPVAIAILYLRTRARFLVLLCLAACVCAPRISLLCNNEHDPPFPVPVRALEFGLATWVQLSHSVSPRLSFVPGANLVLTHVLLSLLPLSALVQTVWLVDSTGNAPPTPSDVPLVGHSTPGLIIVSSLPLFWSTPGQEAVGAGVV